MSEKIRYAFLIILFFISSSFANTNIYIYLTVNDKIITNYDIEKEIKYLQILNPNLAGLNYKKKFEIGKDSLINETIKKEEIIKVFDFTKDNQFVDEYLKNLYSKLNVNNETDFKNALLLNSNHTIDEVKEKLKIEILWNELIYFKYKNQIEIDKKNLLKKIENLDNEIKEEYFLSEIIFEKNINENIDDLFNKIKLSISEIGFNNTANIYSIADSSKLGGKLGWIDVNNLSDIIFKELKKINKGEYTNIIKIKNNYMVLKIDDIRKKEKKINKNEELNKMIQYETNKQLNQFSRIYFEKSKMNYLINEK